MNFTQALHKQQKEIDDCLHNVERLRISRRENPRDGDRIDYAFVDTIRFLQQVNSAQNIVFTVPEGTDFIAERLSFYPSSRFVTPDTATNGVNEISFRPAILSSYEGAFNSLVESDAVIGAVDAFIDISENYTHNGKSVSRRYQNMPTPIELFFAGAVDYRAGGLPAFGVDDRYDSFEFPAAMVFPCPYLLAGGSSMTLRIASTFAGVRSDPAGPIGDATLQNEYCLTAVLEGFKKVWK